MGKEMSEEDYKNLSLMFNQISSEMITDQQNMEQIKHDFAKTGAILYAAYEAFIEAGFSKNGFNQTCFKRPCNQHDGRRKSQWLIYYATR